jgi:alpha-amylase/alpha-mannosidase (GH57 family)
VSDVEAAARRFTVDDLRDLQVWQKLAWIDPSYLDGDPRVRLLIEKGRNFTEADKVLLREVELEILNQVLPAYRARAQAGQIEISASPFYHPILPLLCDTDIYKRTHPHSRMPRHRFVRPDDALEQIERAAACHERLFGQRPIGLWPSEGSVSDAMVPLAVQAGFRWMATDELILARSLGLSFRRDGQGLVDQPERLYRPYRVEVGGTSIACGFRDHVLSDLIGFVYSGWQADAAADDFVRRLADAGRAAERPGGEEPTIFIILDGENAWEHYEGGGRPFLRALYSRLSDHPEIRTVTMAEACAPADERLPGIFPGSWIDANFYIWIGHQDDQRGWSQLAEARAALDSPAPVDAATRARAPDEILIAEGSDWYWWYGDDHSSSHDAEFDDLFRRHLRNVYRLLELPVPNELFASNISGGAALSRQIDATAWISPVIDGRNSSYFEWIGAGSVEAREVRGAMHESERRPPVFARALFGFDSNRLYVRIDGKRPMDDVFREGVSFALLFLNPPQRRVVVQPSAGGSPSLSLFERPGVGEPWELRPSTGEVAAGPILELAIPLAELHEPDEGPLMFFIAVRDLAGLEIERQPAGHPIEVPALDPAFRARNWTA